MKPITLRLNFRPDGPTAPISGWAYNKDIAIHRTCVECKGGECLLGDTWTATDRRTGAAIYRNALTQKQCVEEVKRLADVLEKTRASKAYDEAAAKFRDECADLDYTAAMKAVRQRLNQFDFCHN